MAAKVNTKFVYILLAVLVLLLGGAYAFYQLKIVKSAAEYEALGDKHLVLADNRIDPEMSQEEAGKARKQQAVDYRMAAQNFGQAYNKDRRNVGVLLKYIEALRNIPVNSSKEAQEISGTVYARFRDATELDRDNPQLLERYYQMLYGWGQDTSDPRTFINIFQLASARLDSDPDNTIALKWRGITQTMQLSADMANEKQQQALSDLTRALEARPEDPDLLHYLARYKLFQVRLKQIANAPAAEIKALQDEAVTLSTKAFDTHPNDGQAAIDHVTILLADGIERTQEARPVIDGLASYLSENPDPPLLVRRVVELLPRLDRQRPEGVPDDANVTVGIQRSEKLLREAIEADPDSLLYRVMLGNMLKLQLKLDEAHEVYVAARDQEVFGTAEASLREEQLRQQAVYEVANLELIRAEQAKDTDERNRILKDADAAVDALQIATGETGQVHLLRGKIALLRGDTKQAMIEIDRASALFQDLDVETLLLSAHARQQNNQWGAATKRLQQALQLVRNNPRVELTTRIRLQLAGMLTRSNDLNDARRELEQLLEIEPENPAARRLMAEWYAASGQPERGIEILQGLAPQDNPAVLRSLVQMQARSGKMDDARALVQARFDQNPGDVWALQTLMAMGENKEQKLAYINQARGGAIDPKLLDVLAQQAQGDQALKYEEVVEKLASDDASQIDLTLSKAAHYLSNGQPEQARPFYEQARQLAPGNPQVKLLELDFALVDQEFDKADRLVSVLAKENADSANGHLLRGRVAQAKGNTRQAIAEYAQALQVQPVYDEGWRQYGDLLRTNGDLEPARTAYRTALDQRPDNVRAWIGLAAVEDGQGNRGPALDAMRQAFRNGANDPDIRERYLAYEAQYGQLSRAIEARQAIARDQPDNTENRLRLAMMLASDDQTNEALATLSALEVSQGPSLPLAAAKAQVLLSADRVDEGRTVLESYLAQRGVEATVEGRLALARYLMQSREVDASYAAYREAIAVEDPQQRPASRELADAYFDAGRTAEAVELYRSLYRDLPDEAAQEAIGQRLVEALLRNGEVDQAAQVHGQLAPSAITDSLGAVIAMQREKPDEARKLVDASLKKDDANPMAYLQRATLNANDPERRKSAYDDLEKALSLRPGFPQALSLKANLLMADNRLTDAVGVFEKLVEAVPGNSQARLELAGLYARTGMRDRLGAIITESRSLFPDNPAWLQLSAGLANERGDSEEAIAELERSVQAGATPAAVGRLAVMYLEANRASEAEQLLTSQPEMLNASVAMQALRGRALAAMGQDDSAENVLRVAFERAADPGALDGVIAQAFEAYGSERAVTFVESLSPAIDPGWVKLVVASRLIGEKRYDQARTRLATLRDTPFGQRPELLARIARLEALAAYQAGDLEAAGLAYRRLLKQDPDDLEVLNNLAYLLANDLKRPEEALPLAKRATEIASDNPEVLDTLGWTYYLAGQLPQAQETLKRSVDLRALPVNTLHLGEVYVAMELLGRARETLRQTVELAAAAEDPKTRERAEQLLDQMK